MIDEKRVKELLTRLANLNIIYAWVREHTAELIQSPEAFVRTLTAEAGDLLMTLNEEQVFTPEHWEKIKSDLEKVFQSLEESEGLF